MLGCEEMKEGDAYLGIPALWGKSKREAMKFIMERVKARAQSWKHKLLLMAGKEVMVKAVLQALPAYVMLVLKFLLMS